jgi:hypothetical protein
LLISARTLAIARDYRSTTTNSPSVAEVFAATMICTARDRREHDRDAKLDWQDVVSGNALV